jgi:hypothetical protein
MGTSDSYLYPGRPSTKAAHKTLTTTDPGWESTVADFAEAGIRSMSKPRQQREIPVEPLAGQVTDRAAEVGSRLIAAAVKHRARSADAAEIDRALDAIVDEVFGIEYGTGLVDSVIRECAVRAVSRWLTRQAPAENEPAEGEPAGNEESADLDEILTDPLSVVDPDLLESSEPLPQLLDEFHAELLVELVGLIGGEGMFPGITALKLLWALYRWAVGRIRGASVRRPGFGPNGLPKERERETLERLLGSNESAVPREGDLAPEEAA